MGLCARVMGWQSEVGGSGVWAVEWQDSSAKGEVGLWGGGGQQCWEVEPQDGGKRWGCRVARIR